MLVVVNRDNLRLKELA
jgi:hypothetical protein